MGTVYRVRDRLPKGSNYLKVQNLCSHNRWPRTEDLDQVSHRRREQESWRFDLVHLFSLPLLVDDIEAVKTSDRDTRRLLPHRYSHPNLR